MIENIDIILRGRKLKKLIQRTFSNIRIKYELRQIEIEILVYLSMHFDTSSSEIYRQLFINKGHVSQAMDNLCKKGYINPAQNKADRRYISYVITPLGNTVIEESNKIRKSITDRLFIGFSSEEMQMMKLLSTKLSHNIDHIK